MVRRVKPVNIVGFTTRRIITLIVQRKEHLITNQKVVGSIPTKGACGSKVIGYHQTVNLKD